MSTLRRVLSFVLLVFALSSVAACTPITAYEECTGLPGSNNRCD
jgi:hypothetical protein